MVAYVKTISAGLLLVTAVCTAEAQAPSPQPLRQICLVPSGFVRNWTRTELWRFFEPPAGGGNNDYAYGANRLQLARIS